MQARFLLGPAGSGKTFRCLTEARDELLKSPEGPPLVFVTPKQTTYQIERRILSDPELQGYTRLQVLSFERLAGFVFELLRRPRPDALGEEGRLMVLRALLARHRDKLNVFRASARLAGFSAQLSSVLQEFQRNQLTPAILKQLAAKTKDVEGLAWKVQDLATLLDLYTQWLNEHGLKDADSLLDLAASELKGVSPNLDLFDTASRLNVARLWVDGFAEFSLQELELLTSLAPFCQAATITFCLDRVPREKSSWLSARSVLESAFFACRKRFTQVAGEVVTEVLDRHPQNRFHKNPALQHLERHWDEPIPFSDNGARLAAGSRPLRIITCKNPEAEAVAAAREILKHVRAGGRYRDVAVLVRKLHDYRAPIHRVLTRYDIPFFMDRRESVAHHPAVELTRSALRTVSLGWQNDDFFAALKTGLMPGEDEDIDRLENEALSRGWQGPVWTAPFSLPEEPELERWLQPLVRRVLRPFERLALALAAAGNRPSGMQLAAALREFWVELEIEQQLTDWSEEIPGAAATGVPGSVHATVWDGMNLLLENMELALKDDAVPIRDWLPILEAAFANFSVGVIPPALDQVLVGTVDRSRDPDIQIALVLGLNETVFPSLPETGALLTETDRAELEKHNVLSGAAVRQQLSRERYYAYLACTRAREQLVLTFAAHDTEGTPLNPSPFLDHLRSIFPNVAMEIALSDSAIASSEHISELVAPLLKARPVDLAAIADLPALKRTLEDVSQIGVSQSESLSPALAERLYGRAIRTSVSRIEQYAACPFKFFVHSGLRAQERKRFELDTREQGSFQHDALALFHFDLQKESLRWRDLTPAQARRRIGQIANSLLLTYRDGLFQASERSRFLGTILASWLQDFVETLVEWMREQYQFDPVAVELPFGEDSGAPAYAIELGEGRRLEFKGRIDRIDLWRRPGADEALCVVVDYKSSQKQLDPVLLENGLQLQLVTYLNVLRALSSTTNLFGVKRLVPAGVFYVSLRGKYERKETRDEALQEIREDRKLAYRHTGRFDFSTLRQLDSRPGATQGDQFIYRLTANGRAWKTSREAMDSADFVALLNAAEVKLREMGSEIFSGNARVFPYRKGSLTACLQCDYRAICRADPWSQAYRVLK